jgi:hypothetical protein
MTDSIARYFIDAYKGARNFMTPDLISYGKSGRFVYELSQGEGFSREPIYGVTVLEITNGAMGTTVRRHDLSKMFFNIRDALSYAKNLKSSKGES